MNFSSQGWQIPQGEQRASERATELGFLRWSSMWYVVCGMWRRAYLRTSRGKCYAKPTTSNDTPLAKPKTCDTPELREHRVLVYARVCWCWCVLVPPPNTEYFLFYFFNYIYIHIRTHTRKRERKNIVLPANQASQPPSGHYIQTHTTAAGGSRSRHL